MASKKVKYASMAGVGLMTMSLMACANETEKPTTLGDSMTQNGIQKIENSSVADKCKEYELQKDGSYKCESDGSSNSGGGLAFVPFWFFNGNTYNSHNSMTSSSDYKKNNLVSGTNLSKSKSTQTNATQNKSSKSGTKSSGSKSGGFGSGGRGSSGGS